MNLSSSRFYPADDIKKPAFAKSFKKKKILSLVPGTILILLSGRFKGRRVVFLRQLMSGLLLIAGPYMINGVPIRRVNRAYVISTSTNIDISGIDTTKLTDDYFSKTEENYETKSSCFSTEKQKSRSSLIVSRKTAEFQEAIDNALLAKIKEVPQLKLFLKTRFSLKSCSRPHLMKF
jgi:large subunit ribosomal protein L6e